MTFPHLVIPDPRFQCSRIAVSLMEHHAPKSILLRATVFLSGSPLSFLPPFLPRLLSFFTPGKVKNPLGGNSADFPLLWHLRIDV